MFSMRKRKMTYKNILDYVSKIEEVYVDYLCMDAGFIVIRNRLNEDNTPIVVVSMEEYGVMTVYSEVYEVEGLYTRQIEDLINNMVELSLTPLSQRGGLVYSLETPLKSDTITYYDFCKVVGLEQGYDVQYYLDSIVVLDDNGNAIVKISTKKAYVIDWFGEDNFNTMLGQRFILWQACMSLAYTPIRQRVYYK